MFHPGWRQQALADLAEPFDLVVLGGGITGCGIFFDAAQRGLRVLLVERDDIASGTSSRSSKLIHGGLRYLKQLQFKVTRASCRERDLQLALYPHLVTHQRWIYPAYADDKTPGWQVALGLGLYDRMTRRAEPHRTLTQDELHELAPDLDRAGLERALTYLDARVDDARLTLAVAATGLACGGSLLTRAVAEEALSAPDGRLNGLVMRDLVSGATQTVQAGLVINAAGVWVDRVRHQLGREGRRIRPSRGSHLVLRQQRLKLGAAVTLPSPDDRRPVFFIPHPEGVLVGTTDLFHDGELDDPRPRSAEIDYLLRAARAAFPELHIGRDDIVSSFAGLRPVIAHGLDNPSKASREEAIWHEDGLLSVAGGKLTTWRATAEEVVDRALALLPGQRTRRLAPCATAGTPLADLAPVDLDQHLVAAQGLSPEVAAGMARRLGSRAWTACALAREPSELQPLVDDGDVCTAEVRAHLRFGGVVHLSDLFLRRIRLAMWEPDHVDEMLPGLGAVIRQEMDWDGATWDRELERYAAAQQAWSLEGVMPNAETPP